VDPRQLPPPAEHAPDDVLRPPRPAPALAGGPRAGGGADHDRCPVRRPALPLGLRAQLPARRVLARRWGARRLCSGAPGGQLAQRGRMGRRPGREAARSRGAGHRRRRDRGSRQAGDHAPRPGRLRPARRLPAGRIPGPNAGRERQEGAAVRSLAIRRADRDRHCGSEARQGHRDYRRAAA
jgi:hypothetical protein